MSECRPVSEYGCMVSGFIDLFRDLFEPPPTSKSSLSPHYGRMIVVSMVVWSYGWVGEKNNMRERERVSEGEV